MALCMHGTAIPNLDMGAASLKMNDDGSFNLLIGATDLGTGSDTVLTQMAAEVLGCPPDDFITYSSDTDFTPFDKGAYASSTTYISGAAVVRGGPPGGRADPGSGRAHAGLPGGGYRAGRAPGVGARRPQRELGGGGAGEPAPQPPAADHGRRLLGQPGQPAAVCRPVRGGRRGPGRPAR